MAATRKIGSEREKLEASMLATSSRRENNSRPEINDAHALTRGKNDEATRTYIRRLIYDARVTTRP